jgi:cytochrome c-type biogenesis protein CcmH/NrfG
MVLLAFLIGLAAVVAATAFCVVRGVQLWRQAKRTGGAFSSEVAMFEERSARTERLLDEAERASEDLRAAQERLSLGRARLQVQLDAIERAKKRTRWLRAFLPVR